jgi:hypothetical protein
VTRNSLVDALVRAGLIELGLVLLHSFAKVAFIEDEEEVEAFASHTAQESLADGIGLGCLIGCGQNFDFRPISDSVESIAKLVIVVTNQEAGTCAKGPT